MVQLYVKPYISKYTRPYWEGLQQKKLLAQECSQCGFQFFPARSRCPSCLSKDYKWIELSGEGTLYSWSDVFFLPTRPYVIGVVELKEGIGRSIARIDALPTDLKIGLQLKVKFIEFEDLSMLEWVPI